MYPGIPGATGGLGSFDGGGCCSGGGALPCFHGSGTAGMAGHGLGGDGIAGGPTKDKGEGQPVSASEASTRAR